MFALLKGFSSKTIAIVVGMIIVTLIGTTVFFYKSNNKTQLENGSLKQSTKVLQQNVDFTERSTQITDVVVSDFVENTKVLKSYTDQLRKESIREYVNNKNTEVETPKVVDSSVGADRVSRLAASLHEQYCRARPKDLQCNTEGTDR